MPAKEDKRYQLPFAIKIFVSGKFSNIINSFWRILVAFRKKLTPGRVT